jgi:hypothetical protein
MFTPISPLVSCLKYSERMSMKFSFGSLDVNQNLLDEFMLSLNSPVKTILTLHEAQMGYPLPSVHTFY